MSYRYEEHRGAVITPGGQKQLVRLVRIADAILDEAGTVTAGKLLDKIDSEEGLADSWSKMAIVDAWLECSSALVFEVQHPCAWQDRVFCSRR